MKLGIGSYTYTWAAGVPGHPPARRLTHRDLLEQAVRLGVDVVQFCDNLPLTALTDRQLDELRDWAQEKHLALEVGTRGILDTENLLQNLGIARKLNAPFVRLVVDSTGHEPSPEETVARLQPLMPHFISAGVKIALENHDRFSSRTLAGIVERLGPDRAGICLDTVNSFGALEGPEVVVNTLAPYTLNLHVKDFSIERVSSQMGFVITGRAAGQGRLRVPWLLEQLRALQSGISAILELWTPFGPDLESTLARERDWAERSVQYLRPFFTETNTNER